MSFAQGRVLLGVVFLTAAGLASGCSVPADSGATAPPPTDLSGTTPAVSQQTALGLAEQISSEVSSITAVIPLTEDTDTDDLLGRPNGYSAAVVLVDVGGADCAAPDVRCGATVEEWPDTESVQRRADYIQSIAEDVTFLGSEYHYPVGNLLVRVSGELNPSQVALYEQAIR